MFGDERPELADQLRANVSRFSAYKAAYVRREIDSVAADGTMTEEERKAMTKATISQFSRWTDAELTTATARARTAKQFSEFNDPDRLRLFPNLRWIPSRSAAPRAAHVPFYNRVWSKDDNFWKTNQPGTEWNCKCDIEETDDPATDNSDIEQPPVPKGLEGNPASTGEVFTDNASYIRDMQDISRDISGFWKCNERDRLKNDQDFRQKVMQQNVKCVLEEKEHNILIEETGVDETLQSSFGSPNFVLKNYSLRHLEQTMKESEYLGWKEVDLHNSKKSPKYRFKLDKDVFLYYQGKLPNGEPCYIHVCRNKYNGNIYLYTITTLLNTDNISIGKVPEIG